MEVISGGIHEEDHEELVYRACCEDKMFLNYFFVFLRGTQTCHGLPKNNGLNLSILSIQRHCLVVHVCGLSFLGVLD